MWTTAFLNFFCKVKRWDTPSDLLYVDYFAKKIPPDLHRCHSVVFSLSYPFFLSFAFHSPHCCCCLLGFFLLFAHKRSRHDLICDSKQPRVWDVIQGDFFHWYPPISVPIRKLPSSQSRPILVTGFTGTAAVIGWLTVFFLVLKLGGTSEKITLYNLVKQYKKQFWSQSIAKEKVQNCPNMTISRVKKWSLTSNLQIRRSDPDFGHKQEEFYLVGWYRATQPVLCCWVWQICQWLWWRVGYRYRAARTP